MTLRGSGGKARVIKLGTAAGGDSAPIGADYASFITALVRASGGSGLVRFDWE